MKHSRSSLLVLGLSLVLFTVGACNKEDPAMGASDMAFRSCCGKPGDPGNSLGVGKYCSNQAGAECRTNSFATICSQLLPDPNRPTYFCTQECRPDAGTNTCGDGAKCTMDKGTQQWGCVPAPCVDSPPPGCML